MCTATITNRRIRCASIHPVRFRQPEHQSLLKTVQYIRLTAHAWPRCPSCLASMVLGEGRRYGPGWEKGSGAKDPCMVGRGGRGTLSPAAAALPSRLRALRPSLAPLLRVEPPDGVVRREPDGVVWRDPSRDLAREQCLHGRSNSGTVRVCARACQPLCASKGERQCPGLAHPKAPLKRLVDITASCARRRRLLLRT